MEDLGANAYLNNCVELAVLNKPTTKNTAFVFIKPHAVTEKVKEPAMAGPQEAGLEIVGTHIRTLIGK